MQPTAFLYPGQGRVAERLDRVPPKVDELYNIAAERGLPLRQWMQDEPDRFSRTDAAQPALFLDSLARDLALRAYGIEPIAVAGHSLGEYAALVGAGVLAARDAFETVIERGHLMQQVEGGMVAVLKLDLDTVRGLCDTENGQVVVANHNSPQQVVVSGRSPALERVAARAGDLGGRCIPLPVSGPFHSPFMQPAEDALRPTIERMPFADPAIPVVSSVSGASEAHADTLRRLLLRQITSCVRWVDSIGTLEALGIRRAIEVGSGDTLTRLGRRITDAVEFVPFEEVSR